MKPLTPSERRALRARAHHLDPVVAIGHHGLTAHVLHEIDLGLLKHELVKVRVFNDDRNAREAILAQICTGMGCAAVQHLGKVLVLWRPNPELHRAPVAKPRASIGTNLGSKRRAVKKTGPRTPVDPVRERRRARGDPDAAASGKGRRGAARHAPPEGGTPPPDAPAARRKSTFTPKTRPKSFSAKPNPRSAWEKKPPEVEATRSRAAEPRQAARDSVRPAAGGTRRRRTGEKGLG